LSNDDKPLYRYTPGHLRRASGLLDRIDKPVQAVIVREAAEVIEALSGTITRIRAVTRILMDAGEMTPMAARQIETVLRDEERKHDDKQ
jgi:hypothetical protein